MEPTSTPRRNQARVTDFFSSVVSSNLRSNGRKKASSESSSTKTKHNKTDQNNKLSSIEQAETISFASSESNRAKNVSISSGTKRKPAATPDSSGGDGNSSVTKRAKSAKKQSTKQSTSSRSSSKAAISFGPRVGKLDFDSVIDSPKTITQQSSSSSSNQTDIPKPDSIGTKKLATLDEIKAKLKGCKNLANLKQHLASINDCAEKVKQFKTMKVPLLSPVKPAYAKIGNIRSPEKLSLSGLPIIPSPLRSSGGTPCTPRKKKTLTSPYLANCVRSPRAAEKLACSRKLFDEDNSTTNNNNGDDNNNNNNNNGDKLIPAYKRFAYLSSAEDKQPELSLPVKYKKLADTFKRVDYFAWHYKKRQEVCTFDKLKRQIEIATRRTFEIRTFAQVLTVLSRAQKRWFALSYDRIGGRRQLTIAPLFPDHIKSIHSINMLLEREKEFRNELLELVKREHLKFLAEMRLQLSPGRRVYNWHPMFALDSVPDIVPDDGVLPVAEDQKHQNQRIVVDANNPNSILNYFVRRDEQQQTVSKLIIDSDANDTDSKSAENVEAKSEIATATRSNRVEVGQLKGISLKLLNKVREKEAANKARLMFRSPEIDRQLTMLGRLPVVIRLLDSFYKITHSKSHTTEQVVRKIADGMRCSAALAEQHLDYLLSLDLRSSTDDISRRWLKREQFSNITYLLLDTDCKITFLLDQIKSRIEHLTKQ